MRPSRALLAGRLRCLLVILLCWAASPYFLLCFTAIDALALPITSSNRNKNNSSNSNNRINNKNKKNANRRQESLDAGHNPLLSLNLNLDALARSPNGAQRAEELYCRIAALHAEGYYDVQPDIVSFNSVLKAWSTQGDPVRALEFWERQAGRLSGRLNVRSYNTFLLALARAGLAEAAESLLRQMMYTNAAVRPDRISWNTVLLAYATASACAAGEEDTPAAAERAEAVLQEMIEGVIVMNSDDETNNDNDANDKHKLPPVVDPNYFPPRPDATSFNTVIAAWANSAHDHDNNNNEQQQAAERAEAWLQRMKELESVEPDTYTYTTVLQAWRRVGGPVAVERAFQLLSELEGGGGGSTTSSQTNSPMLLAQPNRVLYTVVLQILSENGKPERAQALLEQRMVRSSNALQPDAVAFCALMNGWAAHAETLSRTDDSNSNDDNLKQRERAVEAVFELLQQMKALAVTLPELTPNDHVYTAVFKTLAAARLFDAGARAKQVLREMMMSPAQLLNNNNTGQRAQPSLIHFNAALDCCAKAPRATKALDAAEIWEEMQQVYCRPDVITYNTVLNAAANAFGSRKLRFDSLEIGRCAFAALRDDPDCDATSLTYTYYFKLLRRLMVDDDDDTNTNGHRRFELVQEAFDLCCQQGCLNEIIWKRVNQMVGSEDKRNELLGSHFAACQKHKWQFTSLPPEWSKRALRDGRKRRRPHPSPREASDALAQ